jgi:pectate lyase
VDRWFVYRAWMHSHPPSQGTRLKSWLLLVSSLMSRGRKFLTPISASISGNTVVKVGSNTSILGANSGITLSGVGLRIIDVSNVIVRNLKISKVLAGAGDAIGIQAASKVWIDHVDLSSDRDHDKDYVRLNHISSKPAHSIFIKYDGLCDITHGSTYITVSWSILHDVRI